MKEILNVVAFDVGNSSIRVSLCRYEHGRISSQLILAEPNEMIAVGELYYWDILRIFSVLKRGLAMAAKQVEHVDSVGVCTWGVDFMLLDKNDNLLSNALSYRNTIGAAEIKSLNEQERCDMFLRTGILCDKINSIYMLRGMKKHMSAVVEAAEKLLMVPDIFVYLFTGEKWNEPSELSTTQMMDVSRVAISQEQCSYAGVSSDLFSSIPKHGQKLGNIRKSILDELDIGYDIPFICVPSHDTACAVMAIPSKEDEYLFISAGTWALIGTQCKAPVITKQVLEANLTNEHGAFGNTTLLRNSAGMFVTQRLKAEYELETGKSIDWNSFTALATQFCSEPTVFDVNNERFFNPKLMVREIQQEIHPDSDGTGYSWPEILACVYASLGESYSKVLQQIIKCTGKKYDSIYIIGGGAKNRIINQRCADEIGLPVITCDMECTTVGNAVAQLAYFMPEQSNEDRRQIIVDSLVTKVIMPQA